MGKLRGEAKNTSGSEKERDSEMKREGGRGEQHRRMDTFGSPPHAAEVRDEPTETIPWRAETRVHKREGTKERDKCVWTRLLSPSSSLTSDVRNSMKANLLSGFNHTERMELPGAMLKLAVAMAVVKNSANRSSRLAAPIGRFPT
jgi:hypothetical protein